jgi:hypothetical protein
MGERGEEDQWAREGAERGREGNDGTLADPRAGREGLTKGGGGATAGGGG